MIGDCIGYATKAANSFSFRQIFKENRRGRHVRRARPGSPPFNRAFFALICSPCILGKAPVMRGVSLNRDADSHKPLDLSRSEIRGGFDASPLIGPSAAHQGPENFPKPKR